MRIYEVGPDSEVLRLCDITTPYLMILIALASNCGIFSINNSRDERETVSTNIE